MSMVLLAIVFIIAAGLGAAGIAQGIVALRDLLKGNRTRKSIIFRIAVCLTCLAFGAGAGYVGALQYIHSPNAFAIQPSPSVTTTGTQTPSLTNTVQPTDTPSPTTPSTPISETMPTTTVLPTGTDDCSGGQSVGWSKWLPNGKWIDNGSTIINETDTTNDVSPTLAGPACGLLKVGSSIHITFTMQGDEGNLYLLVQGTDNGWYGIDFYYGGPNLIINSSIKTFSKQYRLQQGTTYTFMMKIATDGTIDLLDGNGGVIISYGAAFVPNGQWGLKTFYGTFAINSISV